MGNAPSQNQYQPEIMNVKIDSPPEIIKFNEDEIFQKILNISNELFNEFNNDFLKEDFCSKISLVYEKKLSNFNIKLLKSLYNNINSNVSNREMIATLQYLPKNDEKFIDISDMFKDNLHENFWNKNIMLDKSKILPQNTKLKKDNIDEVLGQFGKKYIQFRHVNNLLTSKNKKNNNVNNQNENDQNKNEQNENNKLTKLVGGFIKKNNKLIKKFHKKGGVNPNNEEENEEGNEEENEEGYENENSNLRKSSQYITESLNNSNNTQSSNMNNSRNNSNKISNIQPSNTNITQPPSRTNLTKINNTQLISTNINKNISANISKNISKNISPNISKNISANISANTRRNNSIKMNNISVPAVTTNRKNNLLVIPPTETKINSSSNYKNLTQKTNELILKNQKAEVPPETSKEAFVNSLIKYSVPRSYEKPINLCKGKEGEKCKLSKKDLCTAITQNFIVRNNIIAAILSTIPYKNKNGEYEGGICYQRFLNLEQCKVCVPFEYISLKNKPTDYILQKVLEKADFLDEEKCNSNKGYFLKLTDQEKKILTSKAIESVKNRVNNKTNYNLLFIESSEKLKRTYFENLNSLITILEKMKETPIINNKTLNIISKETKTYIDNMYNLCYYYYIYGIISLIFSEIKENVPQENSVGKFIANSIKK